MRATPVLAALLAVSVLAGCTVERKAESLPDKRPPVQRVEFADNQGKLVVEKAGRGMPPGFPADLPVYRPAKLRSTVKSRGSGEPTMTMAILSTRADASKVTRFYENRLPLLGWTINSTETTGAAFKFNATKANVTASISVSREEGTKGALVSISAAVR